MLYEFTKLRLDESEFNNLIFMNAPRWWKTDKVNHEFLLKICTKPLWFVVEKIIEESGLITATDPAEVFGELQGIRAKKNNGEWEENSWFKSHLQISKDFNKALMGDVWIRNLSKEEKSECENGSFYLEDGNHRVLVYALHNRLKKLPYDPIEAIHATSWDLACGVLNFHPQKTEALIDSGQLKNDENRYYIHNEKKTELPIRIQIYINERRSRLRNP